LRVSTAEELGVVAGESLLALLLNGATSGELHGACGGILKEIRDGAEHIEGGGEFQTALVGLLHIHGLVELSDHAGEVSVVGSRGDDEDLIEAGVSDDLGGGGRLGGRVRDDPLAVDEHRIHTRGVVTRVTVAAAVVVAFFAAIAGGVASDGINPFGFLFLGLGGQGGSATDALRGAFAEQTPERRRAFCGRVAQTAASCGTIEMAALSACLIRTLPAQDSARVARVANATRGNVGGLMQECGISLGR
jgi:hypothetical protein